MSLKNALIFMNKHVIEFADKMQHDLSLETQLSRQEREEFVRQLNRYIIEQAGASKKLLTIADSISLVLLGIIYDSQIFQPYGITLELIDQLDSAE
jgi:hypothetical protein